MRSQEVPVVSAKGGERVYRLLPDAPVSAQREQSSAARSEEVGGVRGDTRRADVRRTGVSPGVDRTTSAFPAEGRTQRTERTQTDSDLLQALLALEGLQSVRILLHPPGLQPLSALERSIPHSSAVPRPQLNFEHISR